MKKIALSDLLQAADRKQLTKEAKAALVLEVSKHIFQKHLPKEMTPKVSMWKNGILHVSVQSAAEASVLQGKATEILEELREVFPDYTIEKVMTKLIREE